jgi:hypothetical protein
MKATTNFLSRQFGKKKHIIHAYQKCCFDFSCGIDQTNKQTILLLLTNFCGFFHQAMPLLLGIPMQNNVVKRPIRRDVNIKSSQFSQLLM